MTEKEKIIRQDIEDIEKNLHDISKNAEGMYKEEIEKAKTSVKLAKDDLYNIKEQGTNFWLKYRVDFYCVIAIVIVLYVLYKVM